MPNDAPTVVHLVTPDGQPLQVNVAGVELVEVKEYEPKREAAYRYRWEGQSCTDE